MVGNVLGIGETNPKLGAIQYDARRIDGLRLIIAGDATEVPVGTICSLQEDIATKRQYVVTGIEAVAVDEYSDPMKIIATGFLEIASQSGLNGIAPAPGIFKTGDSVTLARGIDAVGMAPIDTGDAIDDTNLGIGAAYVTPNGELAHTNGGGDNTAFTIGIVFLGTPSLQMSGQLKPNYAFVRIIQ